MPSIRSRIYRWLLSRSNVFSLDIEPMRRELLASGARARVHRGVIAAKCNIGRVPAVRLTPERARDFTIVYIHGGGGCLGLMPTTVAFASRLAEICRAQVLLPDYRVAPEHPYPAALDDVLTTIEELTTGANARRLVLAGDSFGFGLGLAALLDSSPEQRRRFEMAIGLTPVVDLTGRSETLASRRAVDPFHLPDPLRLARVYANGAHLESPRLSPLFGRLDTLPPLILQAAEDDVFLGDSVHLAERAKEAGGTVDLCVYPGMWHVFQLGAGSLPEANRAIADVADAVQLALGNDPPAQRDPLCSEPRAAERSPDLHAEPRAAIGYQPENAVFGLARRRAASEEFSSR